MEKSPSITKLAAALSGFQSEIHTIITDEDVSVETRTGGSYSFKYVTLAKILQTIKPIMAKHKLCISQLTEDNGAVTTILMHDSGEYLQSTLRLPIDMTGGKNDVQKIGSAITYARRYAVSAILGLATEEDDDGNAAAGNIIKDKNDKGTQYAQKKTQASTPASQLPWITEKELNNAIERINSGELEIINAILKAYKFKKEWSEKFAASKNAAIKKFGPEVLPYKDRKFFNEQLALLDRTEEVDKYFDGLEPEVKSNIAVKALFDIRKRKINKKK